MKPEESQTSSMSHASNAVDYSKQELREEVQRRRIKSFQFVGS